MDNLGKYPVDKVLQCEVSLFSSVFSREAQRLSLGSVLHSFASSLYEKNVSEAREYLHRGDVEMYKACKSMLPVVSFCGVFENGHSKNNLLIYNNIVIIDIDHISDEDLLTAAQHLNQDEYVFAFWKSPSGHGFKGLVLINNEGDAPIDEHHRQAFRQLTNHFLTHYSINIDQSGSDYSRLCYACWDEALTIKETARVFEVNHHIQPITKPTDNPIKHSNKQPSHKGLNRQVYIDTIRDIIQYLRSTGHSITHEYENWLRVAYAIASTFSHRTGVTFFLLLSQQDADKFNPQACQQLLDYCYSHNNGQISFGTIIYLAQKEGYRKKIPFKEMTASEFLDIILTGGGRADEAVYYLLHERLNKLLRKKFEVYENQLLDDFEDVLEDFFLYLREGKNRRNRTPYPSLHRIRKKESFETWLVSTFRNYLTMRAATESQMVTSELYPEQIADAGTQASTLTDERKLAIVSQLIAYTHQTFYPRSRFIFLRSLLTMLNKRKALPNNEIAYALGMTDISYRVSIHRMKCRLAQYRSLLLQGRHLALDDPHLQMAQRIHDDFTHLYPTLLIYYTQSIDTLKCANAIKKLRQKHYEATGNMLHEPDASYSPRLTITILWNHISKLLVV